MNKLSKLKRFLQSNYPNIQAFNCSGCFGDELYEVYNDDGIEVLYCDAYEYIEIFGLDDDEFYSLLDENSFLGDNLRTFLEEELMKGEI